MMYSVDLLHPLKVDGELSRLIRNTSILWLFILTPPISQGEDDHQRG